MLAVISILYGAIVAIGQTSMKRLIGYTSISHFGFIVLGIFALTSQGQSGATLYMVNHGFATGALFLLAGFLIVRRGSDRIADYGGVQKVAPVLAGLFLVSGLAGLSLPGLSTFVSEFLVLVGTFSRYKVAGSFAAAGHRARRDLHPVDVPADDERARSPSSVAAMPDLRLAGAARGGAARRADHRDGRLPEAGARRDQPGRQGHAVPGALDRPGARPSRASPAVRMDAQP